jgi:nucleotide-binding universal stress UspA family protein
MRGSGALEVEGHAVHEVGEDALEARAELAIGESEVVVEGFLCIADRQLVVEHVRAGGRQHLPKLGLRPDGAEQPGASADDGDRFAAQHVPTAIAQRRYSPDVEAERARSRPGAHAHELIVLGHRGHFLGDYLLGSTADRVAHHAHRPVVVVR